VTVHAHRPRGFTLVEMAVTLAIAAVILTMAFVGWGSQRQRAKVTGTILDLRAMVHAARQEALATGDDVAVMVFPDFQVPNGGVGRAIVYRDGNGTFFTALSPVNFGSYDPRTTDADSRSEVLASLDLELGYAFGPAAGQGAGRTLPAPFDNLPLDADCTFCDGGGGARRGAVVFDYAGRARFYSDNGAPLPATTGGSVTLTATEAPEEIRTLAVLAASGAVRLINSQLR
jgi:prepilin-type N-terminal cleavage/methylation domain-containing protein